MTMTRRRLVVGAVSAGTAAAQPSMTGGRANGRLWTGMPRLEKWAYVGGYIDGVGVAVAGIIEGTQVIKADVDTVFAILSPAHMTKAEIASAVDRFFDQPENLIIPIMDAMFIVASRAYGMAEELIQQTITQRRRLANEELDKAKSK